MKQGKLILLGYGTIGKCVFDLLTLDHSYIKRKTGLDVIALDVYIIDRVIPKPFQTNGAKVNIMEIKLSKKSLKELFASLDLSVGDIVIDLTSCTGTRDIIKEVSIRNKACYICTALEGWNGWMYEMPEMVKHTETLKKFLPTGSPTVLLTHGMNPGMVSHFALEAVNILGKSKASDITRIHITETDTQKMSKKDGRKSSLPIAVPRLTVTRPSMPKRIISTWGPQNFVDEMNARPSYVDHGKVTQGKRRAFRVQRESLIYDVQHESVVPYKGYVVTHEETFTLNNYFRKTYDTRADIAFIYKPTSASLKSFLAKGVRCKPGERKGLLLKGPGVTGYDTVGIYMETKDGKTLWIGNACKAGFAANDAIRRKHHNATTMQVAAGVLAGLFVICKAPRLGLRYPEDIPAHLRKDLLHFSERYYGKIHIMVGGT